MKNRAVHPHQEFSRVPAGDVSVPSRVRENTVLKNAHSGGLSNLVKGNANPFFVKEHNALGRAAGITLCTITKTRTLLLVLTRCQFRLLAEKIRNEEAIRARVVVLLSLACSRLRDKWVR